MNKKDIIKLINKHKVKDLSVEMSSCDLIEGVFFKITLGNDKEVFINQWFELRPKFQKPEIQLWEGGNEVETTYINDEDEEDE